MPIQLHLSKSFYWFQGKDKHPTLVVHRGKRIYVFLFCIRGRYPYAQVLAIGISQSWSVFVRMRHMCVRMRDKLAQVFLAQLLLCLIFVYFRFQILGFEENIINRIKDPEGHLEGQPNAS